MHIQKYRTGSNFLKFLFGIAMFALLFSFNISLEPAQANHCGNPPDPWGNASGYANWCSCMGGSYNYSTTACSGATGHRSSPRTNNSSDGLYSNPKGIGWYCYSKARNGAWGWGEHRSRSRAQNIATGFCRQNSRGQRCRITSCKQNANASQRQAIKKGIRQRRTIKRKTRNKRARLSCSVCYRKLVSDVKTGWASRRFRTHVNQSIGGYNNCKRKTRDSCTRGNILVRSLRRGCNQFRGRAYKSCVNRIMRAH